MCSSNELQTSSVQISMREQFIPFRTRVPHTRINSWETFLFLFCIAQDGIPVAHKLLWSRKKKKLYMTSQQVSFHHISSAPKQRVFLNDLLHRRPSVPFCILDNRTKLQAEIRHTDAPHSKVKRTLFRFGVHQKEEGLSFRHDGWMGMSHAYFKMIRCMHSGKPPSKPVCIWTISSVKLEDHIISVMYVRNKTQQGVLL